MAKAKKLVFEPMLAERKTPPADHPYRFPVLASPKIDGVRAMVRDGKLYSRKLKLIPNLYTQRLFGRPELEGLDGELVVGQPNRPNIMQDTMSGVMSVDGEPDVTFHVFDFCKDEMRDEDFADRLAHAHCVGVTQARVRNVGHWPMHNLEQLTAFEAACLAHGFEGAMVRDPRAPYKWGRTTMKENTLLKLKRFEDAEAVIVGFAERMHNENEATTDETGHTKRSTHKENMVPAGDLGAFVCARLGDCEAGMPATLFYSGPTFNCGTGLSAEQRVKFWQKRAELLGQVITYKSFEAAGVVDMPRFPVFKSFRDLRDL